MLEQNTRTANSLDEIKSMMKQRLSDRASAGHEEKNESGTLQEATAPADETQEGEPPASQLASQPKTPL